MGWIKRLKSGRSSGMEQELDWVRSPHNLDLDGNGNKDEADIPASDTCKEPVQNSYGKETKTTAKSGQIQ